MLGLYKDNKPFINSCFINIKQLQLTKGSCSEGNMPVKIKNLIKL